MPAIALATYSICVREERSKETLQLGKFDGSASFLDVFEAFAKALKDNHSIDNGRQSLQHTLRVTRKGSLLSGLLRSGDFGYATDLVNIETLKTSFSRSPEDAELLPFYFALSADPASKTAVLVLQRHGSRGVFTSFMAAFRDWFRERYSDYNFDVKRLVPADVLNRLLNGNLRTIEIKTYEVPSDLASKVKEYGNLRDVGAVTIKIDARRNSFLARPGWLKKVVEKKIRLVEITEELGWENERVRIGVDWEGRKRMIDFHRPESIAPYIDVTAEVEVGADGHPTYASIHKYAVELIQDLETEIGTS